MRRALLGTSIVAMLLAVLAELGQDLAGKGRAVRRPGLTCKTATPAIGLSA